MLRESSNSLPSTELLRALSLFRYQLNPIFTKRKPKMIKSYQYNYKPDYKEPYMQTKPPSPNLPSRKKIKPRTPKKATKEEGREEEKKCE
jgi:hypothetical protein